MKTFLSWYSQVIQEVCREMWREEWLCVVGVLNTGFFPLLSLPLPPKYDLRSALKTYHLTINYNFDLEGKHVKWQLLHVSEG